LQQLFDKNRVFLHSSNQIAVICSFENSDVKEEKLRYEEQLRQVEDIIDYIAGKKYTLNDNMQYYSASLTIGTGSVGTIFKEKDLKDLIKLAQFSMLKAKEHGVNVLIANEQLRIIKRDLDDFNKEIEQGFELDEFTPFFLPIVNTKSMSIIGCESLVRWNKDKYRIIEASKFVEIAEEKNLIEKIDKRVIEKTFQSFSDWANSNLVKDEFYIVINLSRKTLLNIKPKEIVESLESFNLKPKNVEFDISLENVVSHKEICAIKSLKECGFKVAYDVGFHRMSLQYLADIDFDTLKLNRFGLIDEQTENRQYLLYRTLIKISKIMNYNIMAKGIENKRELDICKNFNVDYVEGYYFTKPLDGDGFKLYLNKYKNGIM